MSLTTFEHIEELTSIEQQQVEWLLIELQARHPHGKEWSASQIKQRSASRMQARGGDLAEYPGLRGVQVRKMINFLRANDNPIGSNGKGYYYVQRPEDWDDTTKHLQERLNELHRTFKRCMDMKRAMKNKDRQQELLARDRFSRSQYENGTRVRVIDPSSSYHKRTGTIMFARPSEKGYTVKIADSIVALRPHELIVPLLRHEQLEAI